nr:MAG TPA: hypothetical protein [Caudoviricetes sp.]
MEGGGVNMFTSFPFPKGKSHNGRRWFQWNSF